MNFSGSIFALERSTDPLVILALLPFVIFGLFRASSRFFGTGKVRLTSIALWLGSLLNFGILAEIIGLFVHLRIHTMPAQADLSIFLTIVAISLPVALIAVGVLIFDYFVSRRQRQPLKAVVPKSRAALFGVDVLGAPILYVLLLAVAGRLA